MEAPKTWPEFNLLAVTSGVELDRRRTRTVLGLMASLWGLLVVALVIRGLDGGTVFRSQEGIAITAGFTCMFFGFLLGVWNGPTIPDYSYRR